MILDSRARSPSTGAHSRDYTYDAAEPCRAPSVGWGWLLFGDTAPVYRSDNLLAAWCSYRLPVVIHNAAFDRSVPYAHFERKLVRNVIRYVIVLDTHFNKVFPWRYHLDYSAI